MQTKTKTLIKQTIPISLAIVVAFVSKFIPIISDSFFADETELFEMGYWLLGAFGTLTILYYIFLKKKIDLDLLNSPFRVLAYIFLFNSFVFLFVSIFPSSL
ncbi:hypothetical protein KKA66_02715 [Patescibacteria group bacterium]|nr:hypothetical protein [Patescibacteria group bacterium]